MNMILNNKIVYWTKESEMKKEVIEHSCIERAPLE